MTDHAIARNNVSRIVIVPGYACNFHCAHCGVSGDSKLELGDAEVDALHKTVNAYGFKDLSFVGGEPTLYVEGINRVLSGLTNLKNINVSITTNGHFAKTKKHAEKTIASLAKLDDLNLSYDKFHSPFLPYSNVRHLYEACSCMGVNFSVLLTLQTPLDLALCEKLQRIGRFPIGVQRVLPIGRAKRNGVNYLYSEFDPGVLKTRCPNKGAISYLCGRGFSFCDVAISFEKFGINPEKYIFQDIDDLFNSVFYRRMSGSSFSALLKKCGISIAELSPADSSPCVLCERVFNYTADAGK